MENEFKVLARKAKLTIGEKTFEGRFPFHKERKIFSEKMKNAPADGVLAVVEELFLQLDFPREAIDELDGSNFSEFMTFILAGGSKKN